MAAARTTPRVVALGRSLGHARRAAAMAPLQAVKKVGNRLVKQVEVNDNGKAARVKMHVRVGDTVKVRTNALRKRMRQHHDDASL